jgi:Sulfotransferase family
VRLGWPSKTRVDNDRDGEESRFPRGKAQPDFLCVGAQKGGTSWLYQQLDAHPDFWMPPLKELHYFNELGRVKRTDPARHKDERDGWFLNRLTTLSARSYIDLENYGRLFEWKGMLISGDITPAYSMLSDEIIQEIVSYFPELKVIFLARDPVERAWSQLSMGVRLGMIKPFDATDADAVIQNVLKPGVVLRSYPSKIAGRWRRAVRSDLFQVYFFDDLKENPAELRHRVLNFLGADPAKTTGPVSANRNSDADKKKLRLSEQVRSRLGLFFKKELKACAEELGGRAKHWPARYGFSLIWLLLDLVDDIDLCVVADWLT